MEGLTLESILKVKDLSVDIGNMSIFKNISFSIEKGDAVLLSGANGIGKSTLVKSILRLEMESKRIKGTIFSRWDGNVLELDANSIQNFRSRIAYIQQKDDYSQMGNIQVRDILNESNESFFGKSIGYSEVNDLIDEWIPRKSDNKRVFDAKSYPAKFSGGEQRLLSVLSVIATRSSADLFIIDEPLNNLDFENARNISNLINKAINTNPNMGLIMISHCRIFPFINKELELSHDGIKELKNKYVCHSCFGIPDEKGYY